VQLLHLCTKLSGLYYLNLNNEEFWLLRERAVYWPAKKMIIVADVHLGKTGHFRKSGIAVPQQVFKEDMQRLVTLLQMYKPEQLIIVGDLVHSKQNKELDLFIRWRNNFRLLNIELIKGNHDSLQKSWYDTASINVHADLLQIEKFAFIHDGTDIAKHSIQSDVYFFTGHVHPCVSIKGSSRQSLCFPCYYFSSSYSILPAFSYFTGSAVIEPKRSDTVVAIVNKELIKIG
jgi:DNA ligase-associated metallophosphoesterase